ncbi:hypothetical protein [Streptomyces sp. NPDC005438]|uniref:hypothetical protein n=1 Tax=Streptomyces sp. NPDC005438 TaxID=3156880 RepID=UPI0033A96DB6
MNTPPELDGLLRAGPFHLALRTAIESRGLALHRIQHRLAQQGIRVGVTSLSYWQQGIRRPARSESLRAVRALEQVLELPRESLTRLLTAPAPAREPSPRPYGGSGQPADAVGELLRELDVDPDGGTHCLHHMEDVRIGGRGELLSQSSVQVVRAHRDEVDRFVAVHHGTPGGAPEQVRVRAGDNCRLGTVRRHPSGPVAAELLFDTRLRVGDTHLFGYSFEDGTGEPRREYARGFDHSGAAYVLQVRFDRAALPLRCHSFARGAPHGRTSERRQLALTERDHSVHLARHDVRPGILGIQWQWPGEG